MAEELEYLDVEVINIPLEDGTEMECAIMDQFEVDGQGYIILSPIDGDAIGEETYLYRYAEDGDDMILDYIDSEEELNEISAIYYEMMDSLEEEAEEAEDEEE